MPRPAGIYSLIVPSAVCAAIVGPFRLAAFPLSFFPSMEVPEGVARVRALASLRQVEDTAELLIRVAETCGDRDGAAGSGGTNGAAGDDVGGQDAEAAVTPGAAAAAPPPVALGVDVPDRLAEVMDSLSALASREDAERLLEAGVSLWNSVLVLDRQQGVDAATESALLAIRRIGVDLMRTALSLLGGVSARFSIDEVSLLRFYTAVAKRFASSPQGKAVVAQECFQVAFDLAAAARKVSPSDPASGYAPTAEGALGRALFELELAAAEFGWEGADENDMDAVKAHVLAAATHLNAVPDRVCYFASVLYNLGLHAYHQGRSADAVAWLRRSIRTRAAMGADRLDKRKQAKTARLTAVCLIASEDYDGAVECLRLAEGLAHDCAGAYLLLKVAIVTGQQDVTGLLLATLEDESVPLDIAAASLQLLTTAGRLTEAVDGYELLYKRRGLAQAHDTSAAREVTQRFFQTLVAAGSAQRAVEVLEDALVGVRNAALTDAVKSKESDRWLSLALDAGSSFAERQYFRLAAWVLHKALELKTSSMSFPREKASVVHRLVASCCLCAYDGSNVTRPLDATAAPPVAGAFSSNAPGGVEVVGTGPTALRSIGGTTAAPAPLLLHSIWSGTSLLSTAVEHAEAAKALDSRDFGAHMLLFRAHVLLGDTGAAAAEVEGVHDLPGFSADALVAAACDTNKVAGASGRAAVVSALLAVLSGVAAEGETPAADLLDRDMSSADAVATRKRLRRSRPQTAGFYGLVLKASVGMVLESIQHDASAPYCVDSNKTLFQVLEAGLGCVRQLGVAETFGDDRESSLGFLGDVAWNCGRDAGHAKQHDHELKFFTLCDMLYDLRKPTLASLQTRKIALVLCATCLLDHVNVSNGATRGSLQQDQESAALGAMRVERINQALSAIQSAVGVIIRIQALAAADAKGIGKGQDAQQGAVTDSGMLLLCLLEVRCYARLQDASGLAGAVERAAQLPNCTATLLEQVGWVCREAKTQAGDANTPFSEAAVSACIMALKRALQLRLAKLPSRTGSSGDGPVGAASALSSREKRAKHGAIVGLLRQLLLLAASRVPECAWEYVQHALNLMRGDDVDFRYDLTECRWVVARTWETAQQLGRAGQHTEAARWAASAASMCETAPGRSAGLAAFAEPIREYLQTLPVSAQVAQEVSEML